MRVGRFLSFAFGLIALMAMSAVCAESSEVTSFSKAKSGGWAVVNSDGSLARSKNVASSAHNGTGSFQINFVTDVNKCSYSATLGNAAGNFSIGAGFISVIAGGVLPKNAVVVIINDSGGQNADKPFMLIAQC